MNTNEFNDIINADISKYFYRVNNQKKCISNFKQFQKKLETVDIDNLTELDENKLLDAYDLCRIAKGTTQHFDESEYVYDVLSFDYAKFANTLMQTQNYVSKQVLINKPYLITDFYIEDYERWEFPKLKASYAQIICPPDFNDKIPYSEQQLLSLIKSKQIFFVKYNHFTDHCSDLSDLLEKGLTNSKLKTDINLWGDYDKKTITLPKDTIVQNKGFDFSLKPYAYRDLTETNAFYTQHNSEYCKLIKQLYPNFVKVLLKQLKDNLPAEIAARTENAKQMLHEIKSSVQTSYSLREKYLQQSLNDLNEGKQRMLKKIDKFAAKENEEDSFQL